MADGVRILVTGATGYIGGPLVARVVEAGNRVRVFVRRAARLHRRFETVTSQKATCSTVRAFCLPCDVEVAYYLLHSMS